MAAAGDRVNTAIRKRRRRPLSFAIPVNLARQIGRPGFLETGRVSHPYRRCRLQALTPQLAGRFNAPPPSAACRKINGVVIVEVLEGALPRGRLKPCDLIEQLDAKQVGNPTEVQLAVDRGKVGKDLRCGCRPR